jgi:uncharacterized protein (TIGR02246 family)
MRDRTLSLEDDASVRALVNEFASSWNQHDMKAMHDLDTDDAHWINIVGHHWAGKDAVHKGHAALHKGMFAKTNMSVESMVIRAIAPNVAVVVATMHFGASTDPRWPAQPPHKTRGSFTTVKRERVWKIAHFHNTIIDPRAEDNDPVAWDENGLPAQPRSTGGSGGPR